MSGTDADCELCSQSEPLPDVPVDDPLQKNLVEKLPVKSYSGDKITCTIEFQKSINGSLFLISVGEQLYLNGLEHTDVLYKYITMSQFPSSLRQMCFLATGFSETSASWCWSTTVSHPSVLFPARLHLVQWNSCLSSRGKRKFPVSRSGEFQPKFCHHMNMRG